MQWVGCPNWGYPGKTPGRGEEQIMAIVNHIAQGFAGGMDAWFNNPDSHVSAHYGVMRDGSIHQYVADQDTAWHAAQLADPDTSLPWLPPKTWARGQQVNQRTIGIEHEGFSGQPFTPQQLQATIDLHLFLTETYRIPVDRDYIIGHHRLDTITRKGCPGAAFPWQSLFDALLEACMLSSEQKAEILRNYDVIWGRLNQCVNMAERLRLLDHAVLAQELTEAQEEARAALLNAKDAAGLG